MTMYRVSEAGNNTDGSSWANAYTTLASALAAATASGDVILIDKDHTGDNALAADTTFTFNNNVALICVDKDSSDALATMGTAAWIGHSSSNRSITLAGAYRVYMRGITLRTAGATADSIICGSSDGSHYAFENCYLWHGNTSTSSRLYLGFNANGNAYMSYANCTFRLGNASQSLAVRSHCELRSCSFSSAGTLPDNLFLVADGTSTGGTHLEAVDCDFSAVTNTLFGSSAGLAATARLINCRLGSGVTVLGTQTPANKSSLTATLFDCANGDQHYHMGHYDALGSTVVDTGIYANDGAIYDGANRCSWKIVTSANCSFYTPYMSPWFSVYHSGTSAITPYVEILRDGSTTAYQNNQVWLELSYQGTSGSPLGVLVDDRMTVLGSPANQDAGVGTSGWTGDTGAWSGKIGPAASITPAEIGHLMARVCVGEPSIAVYVDPTIRGRA